MKIIITTILILFTLAVQAKNPVKKVSVHFKNKKNDRIIFCKEKSIPLKAVGELQSNLLRIFISTDAGVKNFSVTGVRGVDKIEIGKFNEIKNMDLNPNEEIETSVEINTRSGQAFVVLDISFEKDSKKYVNFLTIPVGELSAEQISERKKNIQTIITKRPKDAKINPNALSTDSETVHAMQLGN
jgi:hypothetical protein